MRNNILYILLVAVMLLTSCSDFLKEEDKDKVIPRTMEQFEAMLHKEGFLDVSWFYRSEFMTDDITENTTVVTTAKNAYKRLYTWHSDVERTGDGDFSAVNNIMWEQLYNDVLVANYILERSADITDATPSQRNYLEAEASFLRARAYFDLVNIYAEPYDAATAESMQGVPLREGTGIVNDYSRSSVAQVYRQIENDINNAIRLFDASSETKSLWHPNKKAALLLLSRVYLYKGEWQKVVDTATQLIDMCPSGLTRMPLTDEVGVVRSSNPEILHTWGVASNFLSSPEEGVYWNVPTIYGVDGSASMAAYVVSDELLSMYSADDLRPDIYFTSATGKQVTAKWHPKFTKMGGYSYRLAEAFLSRAEAYAALGKLDKAVDDMKTLLSKRIDGDCTSLLPATDDQLTVRKFVVDQRRLELCFEGHRWFDLRRTQSWYPKDITHVFSLASSSSGNVGTVTGTETYTLRHNSPNYTFELPLSETTINPTISRYGKRE